MEIRLQLAAFEVEALKRAFPDVTPDQAATDLVRALMRQKYRVVTKSGQLVRLQGLKMTSQSAVTPHDQR